MPEEKKRNESNGLDRRPDGLDVGVFGKSTDFVDSFIAGCIYAAAVTELIKQTEQINHMLETMTEEEKELIPTLREDLADIDTKWLLATAMFGINA